MAGKIAVVAVCVFLAAAGAHAVLNTDRCVCPEYFAVASAADRHRRGGSCVETRPVSAESPRPWAPPSRRPNGPLFAAHWVAGSKYTASVAQDVMQRGASVRPSGGVGGRHPRAQRRAASEGRSPTRPPGLSSSPTPPCPCPGR